MDPGTAVGVASLGIQVCQALLAYYDDWKSYNAEISGTYDVIDDLARTLISLKASLENNDLDGEKRDRVRRCLQDSEQALRKLSEKLTKLRKHGQPQGLREKAWAELQRAWYPFRASTLAKLREIVADARERLKLAISVLHLDISATSQRILKDVAGHTAQLVHRTGAMETSLSRMTTQTQQILDTQRSDRFQKVKSWLSAPDPWTNHSAARKRHEPDTGTWLLRSNEYQKWKAGEIRHLWLYGQAGCGKTVLCSTVVEDIRSFCDSTGTATSAFFYFTFSEVRKQSYENLLLSLVEQLAWKEPTLSTLAQAREKPDARAPGLEELEKILLTAIQACSKLYLVLDALDESPVDHDVRQNVLEGLERLVCDVYHVQVLVTSREVTQVRESMNVVGARPISIATSAVNSDIKKYTSSQLSRDRNLSKLDPTMKQLVEDTITERAGGMFRWVYCQLHELKKLRVTKPKYVEAALRALPATLDETYERMLAGIEPMLRQEAHALLRWISYAERPLTLAELAEASIVDPTGEGTVDIINRGSLEDTLEILSGLVVCSSTRRRNTSGIFESYSNDGYSDDNDDAIETSSYASGDEEGEGHGEDQHSFHATRAGRKINKHSTVRLAHFSVKEYVESKRIRDTAATNFFLQSAQGHEFLAQSCLAYLIHYSNSDEKRSSNEDLDKFPLLMYAARSWFYHSRLQQSHYVNREIMLLQSKQIRQDWLLVHSPDKSWYRPFENRDHSGHGLYYASILGLYTLVRIFLERGADVNAGGGHYGTALPAASLQGHEKIVEILLERGADVDAGGGGYGSALPAASYEGHEKIVEMLLERGADVDAGGGAFGSALAAASYGGREKIVEILLERGADVDAGGGRFGSALPAASFGGHEKIVEMLLERGADVDAGGGRFGSALPAASYRGHEKIVEILLEQGADVNAKGSNGSALYMACTSKYPISEAGREKVIKKLIAAGADIDAEGPGGTALEVASQEGLQNVVEILLAKGAKR